MKENRFCQIPGFKYSYNAVAEIPKPIEWLDHPLDDQLIHDMKICKIDITSFR